MIKRLLIATSAAALLLTGSAYAGCGDKDSCPGKPEKKASAFAGADAKSDNCDECKGCQKKDKK